MARTTPLVDHAHLREAPDAVPIEVGTTAWYAWLEDATIFAYVDDQGSFTARKEHRGRDAWYWTAYRRRDGKLHRVYLGKSATLTLDRLTAAATALGPGVRVEAQPRTSPPPGISPTPAPPANPILATKLYVPRVRATLLPRPRLVERLRAGLGGRLMLVVAAAGFGKTTLLSESIADRPVAWVSLDAGDNDATRFWGYVLAALNMVAPGIGDTTLALLQAPQLPAQETILTTLLNALTGLRADVALVLDDYHVIEAPTIHDSFTFLVEHLSPHLHVVLVTRADPPLPLARLRARGDLTELRAADLRFTPEEAAAFLTDVMGLPLSTDDAAALEARTEGWIAGLQLAALAMRDRTELSSFIRAFTGSNRFVVDYLAEEVFERQPPELQAFLLQTAVLDRMCSGLCGAVLGLATDALSATGQPGQGVSVDAYSQRMLERLERANLFIILLDDERRWYRYHHLFGDVLRDRLSRGVAAQTVASLHARASAWLEQHDFVEEAVHHGLKAQEWGAVTRMIERVGLGAALSGKAQTVRGWIETMPDALVRVQPTLCIIHAVSSFMTDVVEQGESRLQDAERVVQAGMPEQQARMILGQVAVIRGNMARRAGNLAHCIALSHQALEQTAGSGSIGEATALVNLSRAYEMSGDVSAASEQQVHAAITAAQASRSVFTHLHGTTTLGRLQMLQGRLRAAAATYRETARIAGGAPGMHAPAANVGLGTIFLEWNDLDAAQEQLLPAMDLLSVTATIDADIVVDGYLAFARLQQAVGSTEAARRTLAELIDVAHRRKVWPGLIARGETMRAHLALLQGDLAFAQEWATRTGVRIGQELPYGHFTAYLTLARVWIMQARVAPPPLLLSDALHLLDRLSLAADVDGRKGDVLHVLVLRTMALQAGGNQAAALGVLEQALRLAEPEGYVRVFVDEAAPMAALLEQVAGHTSPIASYAATLLATFPGTPPAQSPTALPAVGPTANHQPARLLDEPLSVRELEILGLIASGHSNQAIADTLIVAVSTVKKHVNNIFGKLEVQSRTQAVVRARALNLL